MNPFVACISTKVKNTFAYYYKYKPVNKHLWLLLQMYNRPELWKFLVNISMGGIKQCPLKNSL